MFDRYVHYKGILHERTEDAPFMGALIVANTCHNNCKDCFNQHLKKAKPYVRLASEIIAEVRQDHFNDGIILGGLEWSEQPDEAIALISCAIAANLHVILYSGLDEKALYDRIPVRCLHGCFIKVGKYDCTKLSSDYKSHGVKLASTNQYIKYLD